MTVRAPGRRQMHLAAYFPGADSTTVWADPRAGSQIGFASIERLARTAERGLFDFFLLADGLRRASTRIGFMTWTWSGGPSRSPC